MTTRIVLVRHGEAECNVREIVGGPAGCTGLSPEGRKQVSALRDRLAATGEIKADVLLSSTLPRAVETAELLAPALGGLDIVQDCDLCELHPGECDGLTWTEYSERYDIDMIAEPEAPISPGGESLTEFRQRVAAALERLARDHEGQTVVVACHGGVIISSLYAWFDVPFSVPVRLDPINSSMTEWERLSDRDPKPWRLVRFNDYAHLATRGA